MRVLGSTKIDKAVEDLVSMLQRNADAYDDLKVETVGIIVELSWDHDRENGSSQGKMIYVCSDGRRWVQRAFFLEAADMDGETFSVEDEEEDE